MHVPERFRVEVTFCVWMSEPQNLTSTTRIQMSLLGDVLKFTGNRPFFLSEVMTTKWSLDLLLYSAVHTCRTDDAQDGRARVGSTGE